MPLLRIIPHSHPWNSKFFNTSCDFSHSFFCTELSGEFHSDPILFSWSIMHVQVDSRVRVLNKFLSVLPYPQVSVFVLPVFHLSLLKSRSFSLRFLNNPPFQLNISLSSSHSFPHPHPHPPWSWKGFLSMSNSLSCPFPPLLGPSSVPYLPSGIFSFHCL